MATATRTVTYNDQETALTGFLAWDDAARRPLPGLLLVHGGAGLDDHAKGRHQVLRRAEERAEANGTANVGDRPPSDALASPAARLAASRASAVRIRAPPAFIRPIRPPRSAPSRRAGRDRLLTSGG